NPGSAANPDTSTAFASGTPGGLRDLKVDAVGNLFYLAGAVGTVHRISFQAPLIYTAPAGTSHNLLLGLAGPTLRLLDNGALVVTRPLAETSGVLVYGAANQPDALPLDNSAGVLALRDGVRFDGGSGGGNTAFLVGTPGGDSFILTPAGFRLDGVLAGAVFNVPGVTAFGGPGDATSLFDGPGNDL